jgi:dTDP-4-amino-4,6-dideoxygalactose transaminase
MEYDVAELGFNYRFDDPRAALLLSRFRRLEGEIDRRRELVRRYMELLGDVEGLAVAYDADAVERSSCYLMGVLVDPPLRSELRTRLRDHHGVQTTVYPAVHRLEAYRRVLGEVSLPRTERVADSLFSIPLFPHLSDEQQDRVVAAVRDSVATIGAGGGG